MLALLSVQTVFAFSLNIGTDGASISEKYNLAPSTSLHEKTMVLDGDVVQSRHARGSDGNHLRQYVSGPNYQASNTFSSSGTFRSSTTTMATDNAAIISQGLSADGDSNIELHGTSGGEAAGQFAVGSDATVQSTQSLIVGGDVVAGQNTAINGNAGAILSSVAAQGQNFDASGGFSGEDGHLSANLISAASDSADMYGTASVSGIECLNSQVLNYISSGQGSMSIDGLYSSKNGELGSVEFAAVKSTPKSSVDKLTSSGSHPEILSNALGNPDSFVIIENRKINPAKPLQLYLKTDSSLTNEKLTASAANLAIKEAAATWDYWTKPGVNNLFKPTVINDAKKKTDTCDGYSVNAFTYLNSYTVAYARTYTDANGYVTESDIVYNTRGTWTTNYNVALKGSLDLQTVALHELGHVCGLGDLYTLSDGDPRKTDYDQIMNYYTNPRHYLGAGDIKGIQTIYGA